LKAPVHFIFMVVPPVIEHVGSFGLDVCGCVRRISGDQSVLGPGENASAKLNQFGSFECSRLRTRFRYLRSGVVLPLAEARHGRDFTQIT
jgi:hypothetical protein